MDKSRIIELKAEIAELEKYIRVRVESPGSLNEQERKAIEGRKAHVIGARAELHILEEA